MTPNGPRRVEARLCSLQDFKPNHESPSIDFLAVHIWPDNWEESHELLSVCFVSRQSDSMCARPPFHVLQANSTFCATANPSCGVQFVENFLTSHTAVATALGKPMIVEEFGKTLDAGVPQSGPERIQDFSAIYGALSTSLAAKGPIQGVPRSLESLGHSSQHLTLPRRVASSCCKCQPCQRSQTCLLL